MCNACEYSISFHLSLIRHLPQLCATSWKNSRLRQLNRLSLCAMLLFSLLNCSRVVPASLGCVSSVYLVLGSEDPPNSRTSVNPRVRLKAVRECLQRGLRKVYSYNRYIGINCSTLIFKSQRSNFACSRRVVLIYMYSVDNHTFLGIFYGFSVHLL